MTKTIRPDTVWFYDAGRHDKVATILLTSILSDPLLKSINTALSKNEVLHYRRAAQHQSHYVITAAGRLVVHAVLFPPLLARGYHKLSCHICGFFDQSSTSVVLNVKTPTSSTVIGTKELKTNYRGYSRTKNCSDLIKTPI